MNIPKLNAPSTEIVDLSTPGARLIAASLTAVAEQKGSQVAAIAQSVNGDLAHLPGESLLFEAVRKATALRGDATTVADVVSGATELLAVDGGRWEGSVARSIFIDLVSNIHHLIGIDSIKEARRHANELVSRRTRQEAIGLLRGGLDELAGGGDINQLASLAKKLEQAISSDTEGSEFASLSQATDDFIEGRVPPAVQTNLTSFDSICGGLPRAVTVLNGPPGAGKTALAAQLALGAMLKDPNATVLWCLGELRPHEFNQRLAALLGQTAGKSLQDELFNAGGCPLSVEELRQEYSALSEAAKATLRFSAEWLDQRMKVWNPDDFSIEGAEAAALRCKPDIMVIDYLQLLSGGDGEGTERADNISKRIKNLARQQDIAIIGISSMAKKMDARTGSAADSSRMSAQFGFDAELVFVGDPPPEEDRRGGSYVVNWVCKKARNGTLTDLALSFDGDRQYFSDGGFVGGF